MNEKTDVSEANLILLATHRKKIKFYKSITNEQWKCFITKYLARFYKKTNTNFHAIPKLTGNYELQIAGSLGYEFIHLKYEIKMSKNEYLNHSLSLTMVECFARTPRSIVSDQKNLAIFTRLWREFLVKEFSQEITPLLIEQRDKKKATLEQQLRNIDNEFKGLID